MPRPRPPYPAEFREKIVPLALGSVGDCYDNAMGESFFATLERRSKASCSTESDS